MNEFRTFIASSLSGDFSDYRKIINQAIRSLENDIPFKFENYLFEGCDTNTARPKGAQNDINEKVGNYHAFVLICDDKIGIKTVDEFHQALSLLLQSKIPAFITILQKKEGNNKPCTSEQISFEEFVNKYLMIHNYDKETGKISSDKYIYHYDFDDINCAVDKLKSDLKKWITTSEYRPLFEAIQGKNLIKDDLYDDPKRKCNVDEKRYFHRSFDDELYNAMIQGEGNNVILINGASLSGKTRALYQAIKGFPDAWFYKFTSNRDEIIADIERVTEFLRFSKSGMQQFLIFDDIHHQYLDSNDNNKKLGEAILKLRRYLGDNTKIIATTTENCDLLGDCINISIKPMDEKEYNEAKLFFYRNGITYEKYYKAIGAMMIDLNGIRNEYNQFINTNTDEKNIRKCLLWSIKAFSVWHSASIGDVQKIYDFTKAFYFSLTQTKVDDDLLLKAFNEFLKLGGINNYNSEETFDVKWGSELPKHIRIEEYIYKYIIGFEGKILSSGAESTLDDERNTLIKIIEYVQTSHNEPVITCLSKLARRAENQKMIANEIFDIVIGCYNYDSINSDLLQTWGVNINGNNEGWYAVLQKEVSKIKEEAKNNPDLINENASDEMQYFSKVVKTKMDLIDSFEERKKIFDMVLPPLQSLPMLGTLIIKCRTDQTSIEDIKKNIETITNMTQYSRDGSYNSFYIITKMIYQYDDFQSAYEIFKKGKLPFEDDVEYVSVSSNNNTDEHNLFIRNYERTWLAKALNALSHRIKNFDELDILLLEIKKYFVFLIDDIELAKRFTESADIYNRDKLTMIDLLSRLDIHGLRGAFKNISKWEKGIPEDVINFITDRLRPDVEKTLQQYREIAAQNTPKDKTRAEDSSIYTQRYKAKQTATNIINVFLESACKCKYSDVLNKVFVEMYANDGNRVIPLRDSFTYARMLEIKDCRYLDGMELYDKYIFKHSIDTEEHFSVTYILLNRLLKLAHTENEYHRAIKLYEDHNAGKDIYTYNNALKHLPYTVCVEDVLPDMVKDKCEFDIYTLGELISKSPSVKVAAGYFYPATNKLRIITDDKGIKDAPTRKEVDKMIEKFTKDYPLESQHYFWAQLFTTKCKDDDDRKILLKMLTYLESQKEENNINLLNNGIIYNNCLDSSKSSFICDYNEAMDFIEKRPWWQGDRYTLTYLVRFIIQKYRGKRERKEAETALNNLYLKYKDVICDQLRKNNTHIYNNSIGIYSSFLDKYSFTIIKKDGEVENVKDATPIKFITYLADNNLPIDKFTIKECFSIDDKSFDSLVSLLNVVEKNNILLNVPITRDLVDNFYQIIPNDKRVETINRIYNLPFYDEIFSRGLLVVHAFSKGHYDIESAFAAVVGNDVEKLYSYTQLYKEYRKKILKRQPKDKAIIIFNKCWDLYGQYIKDKVKTNNSLFSSIINFAQSEPQMKIVFDEMERLHISPAEYVITPIMSNTKSAESALKWINRYKGLGGTITTGVAVDAMLKGIFFWWHKTNSANPTDNPYISELIEFLLRNKEAQNSLPNELGSKFPDFIKYKESGSYVSSATLQLLLGYGVNADTYMENMKGLLSRYYQPEFNIDMKHIYKRSQRLGLNDNQMIEALALYPKLVFAYVKNMKQCNFDTYKKLIDIWLENYTEISSDEVLGAFAHIYNCENETDIYYLQEIINNLCYNWYDTVTIADFLPNNCYDVKYAIIVERHNINSELNNTIIKKRLSQAIDVGNELINSYKNQMLSEDVLQSLSSPECRRYTINSLKGVISLMIANQDKYKIAIILKNILQRLKSVEDLTYFLNIIQNSRLANDKIDENFVLEAIYSIIWQNKECIKTFLEYINNNEIPEDWYPNADFLQKVFKISYTDASRVDGPISRLFVSNVYNSINNFASDLKLYLRLDNAKNPNQAKMIVREYVKNNNRFENGYKFTSGEFVATYVKQAWLQDKLLNIIWQQRRYKTDVLIERNMLSAIFMDEMTSSMFRVLSYRLITYRKREVTQVELLNDLLKICGIDFVYGDLEILDEVARHLQTKEDYNLFISTLCDNNLPIGPSLTEIIVSKIDSLSYKNPNDELLKEISGRIRALAELSLYYKRSSNFKAGYIMMTDEEKLDFNNWDWGNQILYLNDGKYAKRLQNRNISKRISDINKIKSIGLRYIASLKLYKNSSEFKNWCCEDERGINYMTNMLLNFMSEINKSGKEVIGVNYVRRIINLWVELDYINYIYEYAYKKSKKHIQPQRIILALISYYKNQCSNNLIPKYYRNTIEKNLIDIKKASLKAEKNGFPNTFVYLNMLQINNKDKVKEYKGCIKCETSKLKELLKDITDIPNSKIDNKSVILNKSTETSHMEQNK